MKISELPVPAINVPYYQDAETPQGLEEILDSLGGLYDNYNDEKFDYYRQGERPRRDSPFNDGNFSNPNDPPMGDVVKERGDGSDPEGMECVEPPTGGDMGAY